MKCSTGLALTSLVSLVVATMAWAAIEENPAADRPQTEFQFGVPAKGSLLVISDNGRLQSIELDNGQIRDYGLLERQLGSHLAHRDHRVLLIAENEICEVSLDSGKVVRSAEQSVGLGRVGYVDQDRVFVQDGRSLEVINLATNTRLHRIELCPTDSTPWNSPLDCPHAIEKERLCVALANGKAIAVVDLGKGKITRTLELQHEPVIGLALSGQNLYAAKLGVSYGYVHENLTVTNLADATTRELMLPRSEERSPEPIQFRDQAYVPMNLVSNPDGGFCVASIGGVYCFDKDGNMIARAAPLQPGQRLLAATNQAAIVACPTGVKTIEWIAVPKTLDGESR